MRAQVHETIDAIGPDRLAALAGGGLDFSYGLLRALERSLWGDLLVRYPAIESDDGTLLAFTPVYVGSNLNFNALLPMAVQKGYDALVAGLGMAAATRAAVAGCLISDRGWIPMRPDLVDRPGALRLLLQAIERLAREQKAQLLLLKDIHRDYPALERALMRQAGFTEGFSLPTIRVNTAYASFAEFKAKQLSRNGRRHARKQFHKAEGSFTLRVVEDFEHLVPRIFPLHRAVFLKARYQFEELPPRFFAECAKSTRPRTELVVCETPEGRIVGSLLIFYDTGEQLNKRIGLDYGQADTGLIYNLLNYTGLRRAIERGLPTVWLGQSAYLPKTRMGGELEDQYVLLKALNPALKPSLPLQRRWMARYSAAKIQAEVEQGVAP
ncbi:MAG TPA: GNAT family N-acetyltransferase [Thermoanaerobaculia bacterium]|nr:GNAT family N-acetyltransferase [Thermoanaerobaculia bacterium]